MLIEQNEKLAKADSEHYLQCLQKAQQHLPKFSSLHQRKGRRRKWRRPRKGNSTNWRTKTQVRWQTPNRMLKGRRSLTRDRQWFRMSPSKDWSVVRVVNLWGRWSSASVTILNAMWSCMKLVSSSHVSPLMLSRVWQGMEKTAVRSVVSAAGRRTHVRWRINNPTFLKRYLWNFSIESIYVYHPSSFSFFYLSLHIRSIRVWKYSIASHFTGYLMMRTTLKQGVFRLVRLGLVLS